MSISPPKLLRCYIVGESVTVFPEEIRILEFESDDFIKRSTQCEWVQHSEWLNATKERRTESTLFLSWDIWSSSPDPAIIALVIRPSSLT